jgi:N-acetylmuramoyl-L-alanine amidase
MVKKIKYFVLPGLLVLMAMAFVRPGKVGTGIKTIVIDPGHGGKDPGCSGASHNEKEVALAVALKLGKLIEENFKDVKVIYTRTTDVFVELEDRAQIANKAKADLFISIHCNAAGKPVMVKDPKTGKKRPKTFKNKKGKLVVVEKPNPIPFGTETYVMGLKNEEGKMKVATRENSAIFLEEDYETKYGGFDPESEESYIIMSNYTSAYVIQSASLAMKIQEEYTKKAGRIDKGVHRQSIWVLWRTSMPSILTELGYLTNPLEETFMASEKGQDYLAKSIFRGLRRYKDEVEGKKKEYNDDIENQEPLDNENIRAGNIPGQKKAADEEEEDEVKEVKQTAASEKPEKEKEKEPDSYRAEKPPGENPSDPKKEAKEKLDDDAYAQIELNTKDTIVVPTVTEDTTLSAAEIALKFKKETGKKATKAKDPAPKKEPVLPKTKITSETTNKLLEEKKAEVKKEEGVVFKVQFASSEVALDLGQAKFSAINEGSFYKVKSIFKYTSGSFTALSDAVKHQNQLREKGFKDCFVVAFKNGERMDIKEARLLTGQ